MAERGTAGEHPETQDYRWATALAAMLVGAAFFALWFWLLPGWLGFRVESRRRRELAMAGGDSVCAGICGSVALRVGFRMDGTRHACADGSAAAIGGRQAVTAT